VCRCWYWLARKRPRKEHAYKATPTEVAVHLVTGTLASIVAMAGPQDVHTGMRKVVGVRFVHKLQKEPPRLVHEVDIASTAQDTLQAAPLLQRAAAGEAAMNLEGRTLGV